MLFVVYGQYLVVYSCLSVHYADIYINIGLQKFTTDTGGGSLCVTPTNNKESLVDESNFWSINVY